MSTTRGRPARGRVLLLLASVALAVLGVYVAWRAAAAVPTDVPTSAHAADGARAAGDRDTPSAPPELEAPPAHEAAAERLGAGPAALALGPDAESAPYEIDATPREPVEVLVVDAASDSPVADAEVRWANFAELEFHGSERPNFAPDPLARFERARRARTDQDGLATIDARVFPGEVLALHGQRLGRALVGEGTTRPLRVVIAPDLGLVIEVVDAAGRAVEGVPVVLRHVPHLATMGQMWRGRTGADGRAHVRSLGSGTPGAPTPPGTAHACLDVLLRDAVCAPVDLAALPREPVRLVLPPTGSVRVALRDELDRPATAAFVHLGRAEQADARGDLRWSARGFVPDVLRPGEAHYAHVGLGLDLHAVAEFVFGRAIARGPGPTRAGEHVELALATGPARLVLTARLVTDRGTPLASRRVQVGCDGKSGSMTTPLLTDARGALRFPTSVPIGQPFDALFTASPIGLGPGEGGSARVRIDLPVAPPEHDLGDLVVDLAPLVGEGLVVDGAGAPVENARFTLLVRRAGDDAWHADPLVLVRASPGGRFSVRADGALERLRIAAEVAQLAPSGPLDFEPGARGLRLVLGHPCEITGRALVDAGLAPGRVRVRAIEAGAASPDAAGPSLLDPRLAADGSFRLGPLRAGIYDLEFRLGGNGAPFHRIDRVEVAPGVGATDARLDAVDLRGKVPTAPAR